MTRARWFTGTCGRFAISLVLMTSSSAAFAYIDPGVTYALLQALFVFVFGAAAAFIVRPWSWIKGLFKKDVGSEEPDGAPSSEESEYDSSSR